MISTQSVPVVAGTPPTFAAPVLTAETVEVGTLLIVKNGGAGNITVTLETPGTLNTGDAYPDKVYTLAAGTESWIPVLPDYKAPGGLAAVTFSTKTSVLVAAINRV